MPLDIARSRALLSMTSPLGGDVLIPVALHAHEALSTPFLCTVDLISERDGIDPDTLLHQPCCVKLTLTECPPRYLHGLARSFTPTGALPRGLSSYRMEIVPALWFLSQTEDCRIFENKSAKDIIQAILSEHGITPSFRVEEPAVRPLTVQYNEPDLNFVTRLMEEEGWFYLFRHEAAAHTLVITDTGATFTAVPDGAVTLRVDPGLVHLTEWQAGRATALGKVAMGDFDPEKPSTPLSGETATTAGAAGATLRDAYHWPARETKAAAITLRTRRRIEAAEAAANMASGTGFNPGFLAGGRIQVAPRPHAPKMEYIIHGVTHQAADGTWCNDAAPPAYSNTFQAFPADKPWRPACITPRPRMEGLYSAEVIGPEGEEIHTDAMGRVKLRFHWDHRKSATASGIWVRVMQAWSGARAGWTFIPRVGTEVGVSFLDGDPDRPIVIGQIHNGEQLPPWPLPDQKTRSGLRTRSTPGGGEQNGSEFYFDDKAGKELVFLHAERDLKVEVENDSTHAITNNRRATIAQGDDTVTVQQGSRTVDVPLGDHTIRSDQGNIAVRTNLGDVTVKTSAGAISIEAMQSITLKVGSSSITLDPSGVTIKAIQVQVEGEALASLKAPLTQIDAEGMLKASGGIMMLN
jgi:type VI secretion system secreted protein VgrG